MAGNRTGTVQCARCQHEIGSPKSQDRSPVTDAGINADAGIDLRSFDKAETFQPPHAPIDSGGFEADAHLRALTRKLCKPSSSEGTSSEFVGGSAHEMLQHLRFDQSEDHFVDQQSVIQPMNHLRRAQPEERKQTVSWLTTAIGTIGLVGGAGLMGWSIAIGSSRLWAPGLALALVGQGILILGLVKLVTHLWKHGRQSSQTLGEVQTQLGEISQMAEQLVAMRNTSAPAFYADLARGANPQMLLTNLKGQLDQLATRIQTEIR